MNKSAILHIPQSQYAFADNETTMTIRIRSAANDLTRCTLYYGDRACRKSPVDFFPIPMVLSARDDLFDYYEISFKSPFNRVCYYFKLEKGEEWSYFYSNQFSKELPDFMLNGTVIEGRSEYYQYPIILKGEILDVPEWFKHALVYNIFPDSFASNRRSLDKKEKALTLPNGLISRSKLGGTIKGITQNLDYIADMGFTCIYLNPIFTAGESHKYDVLDYFHIDPCFGSDDDFRELVEKIHEKNMYIIIDGVFNHCSWHFFAFEDVVKYGEASEYKDWFYDLKYPVVRPADCKEIPSYACFAYERKMPKLNTSNEKVQEYFKKVCIHWIREFKVDGWRLDVANEVDRNFWRTFRKAAKEENPNSVLIGEVWENAETWLRGDAFDSTMNYDFRKHCRDFFAMERIDSFQFAGEINKMLLRYPTNIMAGQLNLLDSHDVPRFLSLCSDDIRRWKLAFLFLILCPGVPSMFYGDEKQIKGITEEQYRSPMPWQNEKEEMQHFVENIIQIRKNHISIKSDYQVVQADKESRVFIFRRGGEANQLLLCMNAADHNDSINLPAINRIVMEDGVMRDLSKTLIQPYGYGIYLL